MKKNGRQRIESLVVISESICVCHASSFYDQTFFGGIYLPRPPFATTERKEGSGRRRSRVGDHHYIWTSANKRLAEQEEERGRRAEKEEENETEKKTRKRNSKKKKRTKAERKQSKPREKESV